MTKKEEWDIWNSILNITRRMIGKKEVSKEYNPYLHSKHEKVIVINYDVLQELIKLKYGAFSNFIDTYGVDKGYVYAALKGRPLTKNALNKILMKAEIPYKNIEIKGVV